MEDPIREASIETETLDVNICGAWVAVQMGLEVRICIGKCIDKIVAKYWKGPGLLVQNVCRGVVQLLSEEVFTLDGQKRAVHDVGMLTMKG